jgi:hypothetical protein
LRIPENGSISMNLGDLYTHSQVDFDVDLETDERVLAGKPATGAALTRVSALVERVRKLADTQRRLDLCRSVVCERDFAALAEVVEQGYQRDKFTTILSVHTFHLKMFLFISMGWFNISHQINRYTRWVVVCMD